MTTTTVTVKEPLVKPVVNLTTTTKAFLGTVVVTTATYVVLDVIRHNLIAGYVPTWLMSLGLSATAISYITIALGILSIAAVSWIIYRFLFTKKE